MSNNPTLETWLASPIGKAASTMAANGAHLFPCHGITDTLQCTCGKNPCNAGKHPFTKNGFIDATNDMAKLAELFKYRTDLNLAMATGEKSGVIILDIDGDKGGWASLDIMQVIYGELPETPTTITGNGEHRCFNNPPEKIKSRAKALGDDYPGLDIRSDGGYVIVPPSRHVSGKFYQWKPDMVIGKPNMPVWLIDLLKPQEKHFTDDNSTGKQSKEWPEEEVFRMLAVLDPNMDYSSWLHVGMALHAGGFPLTMWDAWSMSQDCTKYRKGGCEKRWHKFNAGDGITMGTLVRMAREAGWEEDVASQFDAIDEESPDDHPKDKYKNRGLYYKKPSEISPNLDDVAIVEDFLNEGGMSVMYGDSNTGKTFVAMDVGFHIAIGRTWDNKRVIQGGVVYVAAEGGKSAQNRVAALKKHYNIQDFPFYLVPCPIDLLNPKADTKPLIELIQKAERDAATSIRLVVIDTLSRALAGGDENGSQDMGAYVKNIDEIRDATKAHVMSVHHCGKDKAKGARGHSLLRAATDTEIEIADKTIKVTKQRDMDFTKSIGFELKVVELGKNTYGKPITSCVIETVDIQARDEFNIEALDPRDIVVLNALIDAVANTKTSMGGLPTVDQKTWGEYCKKVDLARVPGCPVWPTDQDNFNKAFKRSRDRLRTHGCVNNIWGKQWVVIKQDSPGHPTDT